jgi:hypothetical protein
MSEAANKKVVVLIMIYQESLTQFEIVSLKQCLTVLKSHNLRIVKPISLNLSSWGLNLDQITYENFPDKYFKGIGAYSRLLISPAFYKRFIDFEYLLIYQLDAFVFRDELIQWCNSGYDFIGSPWFENFSSEDGNARLTGVGNGGFSLRKVQSHLKVLHSFSYLSQPKENWTLRMSAMPKGLNLLKQAGGFILDLITRNNTFWLFNSFRGFEDQFWSLIVPKNFTWFKTAGIKEAMNFSIEMQPRRVFSMNDRKLPFGCHAWWKYDLEFWKPHIENFGYHLAAGDSTSGDIGLSVEDNFKP